MKKYLLDTSICVFLFRRKYGIAEKLQKVGALQCYVSEVTIAELKYGAYKSDRIKEFYAQEKNRLRSLGVSIEDFDLLIGSAACSGNLILVTDNVKHFANIKGLAIENWVKR